MMWVVFSFSVFFSIQVVFHFTWVLTMRKNALRHEPLSTLRQSPVRAKDCPASRWRKDKCWLSQLGCVPELCVQCVGFS